MFKSLDQTLAGAIDIIADDVQATVKSVREQGMMRTLGDAVEDAAGMVKSGAGTVLSSVVGGKKGPAQISNHAGVSSSYADLCAGPGSRSFGPMGGGQPIFPYTPSPNAGKPGGGGSRAAPKATAAANFAPGIGIQRASTAPFQTPGGVQVFAKAPAAPPAYLGPGTAQMRSYGGPTAPPLAPAAPAPSASSAPSGGTKQAPLSATVLASRFDVLYNKDAANQRCLDCGVPNPEWASVSFGILLCIECAGHHRQMGTHISRIRSCKMDSWTEMQLHVFDHSGNRQCAEFFAANGISNAARFQRYQTPAAEWYRESWIKNRLFCKPVPAPPQGVVAGPCVDRQAAAAKAPAAKAAPPADLLDLGGEQPAPAAKPAAQADLLGFGDAPAPASKPQARPADADLLGVGAAASSPAPAIGGGGDLLGLGSTAPAQAASPDIFSLAATAQSARPAAAQLASLDFAAPATPAPAAQAPAPAAPAAASPSAGANTLGGGAKLVDQQKEEKASDPFAMALEKWGM